MPATRPPTSEAVPVMVTVWPWLMLVPPVGEVITAVGAVWSVEAWASTRLACSVSRLDAHVGEQVDHGLLHGRADRRRKAADRGRIGSTIPRTT